MTDPMYPGLPAPRSRPTVVTISSYLLYASVAASTIGALLSLTTVGTIRDVYADLYDDTASAGMESVLVAASVIGVVINILFAAGMAILAIYNNRGKQTARIITWVLGGFFLCCNGFGLLGNAATSGMNLDAGNTGGPSPREVETRLSDALPGWFTPISTLLTLLVVLALLGAVILLALPAANAYFRPQPAAWDPMMPYPAYPGQQPPYPGQQPPYPGQPYPGPGGFPAYPAGASPQGEPSTPPPYPGQPYPGPGGSPAYPAGPPPQGEPSTPPPGSVPPVTGPPVTGPPPGGPADAAPHTGSMPATDPWGVPPPGSVPPGSVPPGSAPPGSAQPGSAQPGSPQSGAPTDDQPGRSPTDPA